MKVSVTFDIDKQLAIKILAVSLFTEAAINSRSDIYTSIRSHLSIFGPIVWPELRGLTPSPKKIKELTKEAKDALNTYWPSFPN